MSGEPEPAEPPAQRWCFFAGKGGVGKTTLAAARAIALARGGARVLCVSTDPAHSLGDALLAKLSARPRQIALGRAPGGRARSRGKAGGALFAAELDADRALARWLATRRRALRQIAARGTYLDDAEIDALFDLSLPGVDELVGLSELQRLSLGYDVLVVDAAPTGHTLRLLEMPETLLRVSRVLDQMQEKHRMLAEALGQGAYRPDLADAAIAELRREAEGLRARLRDPQRCGFSWVLLPEPLPLAEAEDGVLALRTLGIHVDEAVVNRVTPPPEQPCELCSGRVVEEARTLSRARRALLGLELRFVAAEAGEPRGVAALSALQLVSQLPRLGRTSARPRPPALRSEAQVLAQLAPGGTRLILFGGKGGVGKTTSAAAAALLLARAGQRVLLLSTDPAHSLGDVLGVQLSDAELNIPGAPATLLARELDAAQALAAQRDRFQRGVDELFEALRGGSRFEATLDRGIVRSLVDLAPPGMDELFALLTLIDALVPADAGGASPPPPRYDVVVVDTAPTGHALRLLALQETALSWTRALLALLLRYRSAIGLGDAAASLTRTARELRLLGELLRDPRRARFIAVTRAAELPALETVRLFAALRRLRVPAPLVLVNALTGRGGPAGCPRCRRAAAAETKSLRRLRSARALRRVELFSAQAWASPPRGVKPLLRFARSWTKETA